MKRRQTKTDNLKNHPPITARLTTARVKAGAYSGTILDIPGITINSVELRHSGYRMKDVLGNQITFTCTICNRRQHLTLRSWHTLRNTDTPICKCQRTTHPGRKRSDAIRHGTVYCYRGYRLNGEEIRPPCRCPKCVAAHNESSLRYYHNRAAKLKVMGKSLDKARKDKRASKTTKSL